MSASPAKTQRGIQSVEVAAACCRRWPCAPALAAGGAGGRGRTVLGAGPHLPWSLTAAGPDQAHPGDGHYEPGPLALRLGMARLAQEPAYRLAPAAAALSQDTA
jgi:hypothetical protein